MSRGPTAAEPVGHVGPAGYDEVVVGMHANDWDAIDSVRARVGESAEAVRGTAGRS